MLKNAAANKGLGEKRNGGGGQSEVSYRLKIKSEFETSQR